MSGTSIQFYGERGVVNSILLDINDNNEKLNKFFGAIKLFKNDPLPWKNNVTDCKWLVEPCLAKFGDPDIIAVINAGTKKYALFFEAKLKDYETCSLFISDDMKEKTTESEKKYSGQSSKLNIQLSLRHRFIQAYKRDIDLRKVDDPIIEDEGYHHPDGHRRKLSNVSVLKSVREFFKGVDDFYFIALTNDKPNVSLSEIGLHFHPPIFIDKNSTFSNFCFGLLTYSSLLKLGAISRDSGFFQHANRLMNLDIVTEEKIEKTSLLSITGINLAEWKDELLQLARGFVTDHQLRLKEEKGSFSASIYGKTVMKLMIVPDDRDRLMFGFIDNGGISSDDIRGLELRKYSINQKVFLFIPFSERQNDKIHELALKYMDSYLVGNS